MEPSPHKRAKSATPSSRTKTKLPNFAEIHRKNFEKLESIVEHKQRTLERAQSLLALPTKSNKKSRRKLRKSKSTGSHEEINEKIITDAAVDNETEIIYNLLESEVISNQTEEFVVPVITITSENNHVENDENATKNIENDDKIQEQPAGSVELSNDEGQLPKNVASVPKDASFIIDQQNEPSIILPVVESGATTEIFEENVDENKSAADVYVPENVIDVVENTDDDDVFETANEETVGASQLINAFPSTDDCVEDVDSSQSTTEENESIIEIFDSPVTKENLENTLPVMQKKNSILKTHIDRRLKTQKSVSLKPQSPTTPIQRNPSITLSQRQATPKAPRITSSTPKRINSKIENSIKDYKTPIKLPLKSPSTKKPENLIAPINKVSHSNVRKPLQPVKATGQHNTVVKNNQIIVPAKATNLFAYSSQTEKKLKTIKNVAIDANKSHGTLNKINDRQDRRQAMYKSRTVSPKSKPSAQQKSLEMRGVRVNRRFELQMKFRNMN